MISTIEQATKAESRSDAGEFREALLSLRCMVMAY
jgi:hypothetical protein